MNDPRITFFTATLLATLLAGCGSSSPSSRLPASAEIDAWTLSAAPTVLNTNTALYSQIDGGAPKYIDRGWVSGVYATYQQGGSTIQVALHDMGTANNAQAIFQYDLPLSRVTIGTYAYAVVDMGLPTAYKANAAANKFYIEVSIDERSDAALDYVKRFTLAIIGRCA